MRTILHRLIPGRLACWAALLLLLSHAPALAWNRAGHMVTGAIAYRELKANDPAALWQILELLRRHPQYDAKWAPQLAGFEGEDRDLYLFMLAARWADDIRNVPFFHRDVWHYINYPYEPPSTAIRSTPPGENVVEALVQNRALVRSGETPAARAVALCWVMHLTGDVHQPLHTVQLFDATFERGDRGGTAFYIRAEEGGQPLSLHQLWDGLVIGSDRFQAVRNTATELMQRPELRKELLAQELKETAPERWARLESFPLAVKSVYLNGSLVSSLTKGDAKLVPAGYLERSKAVAERQLTLAGYRLALNLRALGKPLP